MRIDWRDIARETYDDIVSVLLYRLHPKAERIDGSGGDEGRDVQLLTPEGLSVFQLKSFTGRMTNARRRQVKKSLDRALEASPSAWSLVVPIDPTPAEQRWFKTLAESASCPLQWKGLTWLDSEMSLRPDIAPYFLNGAKDEVLSLLVQLQQEQAAVENVQDAVARLRDLRTRLNQIDPYYRYDIAIGDAADTAPPPTSVLSVRIEDARVDVIPRYRGATQDRPITAKLEVAFTPEDNELKDAFIRSLDYGTSVTLPEHVVRRVSVDAPGGLGVSFAGGSVASGQIAPDGSDVPIVAEVHRGQEVLASLPMTLRIRTRGTKGSIFDAHDRTGWLRAEMTFTPGEHSFMANFRVEPSPQMPSALLPVLRWLLAFRSPNQLVLRGDIPEISAPIPLQDTPTAEEEEEFVRVVEALDEVQHTSGVYFDCPPEIKAGEAEEVFHVRRLLAGEQVKGTWSRFEMGFKVRKELDLTPFISQAGASLLIEADQEAELFGHRIPMGRIRTQILSARLGDPSALDDARKRRRRTVNLEIVPGKSAAWLAQRLPQQARDMKSA